MTAAQLFQHAWISQENITLSSTLQSGCVTQPGPDLPGSLTHSLAAAATASHHSSLQPVSTAAREPSKGENHTSSISVTRCRFFPTRTPESKGRWSRTYWKSNIIAGWVIRSICCLSLATTTWIPSFLRNNQYGGLYPKKVKSRLVWSVLVFIVMVMRAGQRFSQVLQEFSSNAHLKSVTHNPQQGYLQPWRNTQQPDRAGNKKHGGFLCL